MHQDKKVDYYNISWQVLQRAHPYKEGGSRCDLCAGEKIHIDINQSTLNKSIRYRNSFPSVDTQRALLALLSTVKWTFPIECSQKLTTKMIEHAKIDNIWICGCMTNFVKTCPPPLLLCNDCTLYCFTIDHASKTTKFDIFKMVTTCLHCSIMAECNTMIFILAA